MTKHTWHVVVALVAMTACGRSVKPAVPQGAPAASPLVSVMPQPALVERRDAEPFTIGPETVIVAGASDAETRRIAGALAEWCRRATGALPQVTESSAVAPGRAVIELTRNGASADLGDEGYELEVARNLVTLKARSAAGLFYGVQTLRQLMPYWNEYRAVMFRQPRPVAIPATHIRDVPRYAWRGAMLDVARHFFGVEDVKRFIDLLAMNKMNRLHLHLSDDQGWRVEIGSWPNLTTHGGGTQVGGGGGGFYTKAQYRDLVSYAAERFITVVPEVDMPGHINAALASYADLNCNGTAPPLYAGTDVGFSNLCVGKDVTYRFIDDVVREIGEMSGPYFHVGGDEVKTLTAEQYKTFVERVQSIVQAHGKQMIGWDEVAAVQLLPSSIVQHWRPDASKQELARAPHLILSPANRAYLDMKYGKSTELGLDWAGLIPVRTAYAWNPAELVPGAPASAVLGVEAPLWSETVATIRDVEFLAMPRLAAIAELGWSPAASHDWEAFRVRLGRQAPRWTALGINFYRAAGVPWSDMPQ